MRCIYESGFIRFVSSGASELVRSIYPAVRDQSWQTAPFRISDEKIVQTEEGFQITYQADFALDDLRYKAHVFISAERGQNLEVVFDGIAESDFLRNRIGLCALLSPEGIRGRECLVGHPDGSRSILSFPENIHPVQPFTNIASLEFEAVAGARVTMEFSGDIFETEDQRNWGDASYKIYSTPHDLAIPVSVRSGDRVRQAIRIVYPSGSQEIKTSMTDSPVLFQTGHAADSFPRIGYCYNPDGKTPDEETIRLLRRLEPDHYRIELFLSGNWRQTWKNESETAGRLRTKLLVAVYCDYVQADDLLPAFLAEAAKQQGLISGLLLFTGLTPLTTAGASKKIRAEIARWLPGVRVGCGTDTFFAHWNQQENIPEQAGDFVAVPVSPTVHQPDTLTMIENLPAMADIVSTIRAYSAPPVFIGPVTLKPRYNPDSVDAKGKPNRFPYAVDPRQPGIFAAAWTAIALRYLHKAEKVSLFEITGERGIIPSTLPATGVAARRVHPVYVLLREIAAFGPLKASQSRSSRPTEVDGLVMENKAGGRLMIFCNFTAGTQTMQLRTGRWKSQSLFFKTLAPADIDEMLEDGEKFRSAPYEPLVLTEGESCRIPAGALLFISTIRDLGFA